MPAAGAGVQVTASRGRRYSRGGIEVHRLQLHPDDVTERDGIPVTSVARTLFDLAETLPPRQLERVFDKAEQLQVFDLRAIERVRDRCHGRHALASLDALLSEYQGPLPTRSELERLCLDLLRENGMPVPVLNVTVAGIEVDMVWQAQQVVLELDGYRYHRSRKAFERDRERHNVLQLTGYRVYRVTYRRLQNHAAEVIADLLDLLAL
jgi:hypothetical protein